MGPSASGTECHGVVLCGNSVFGLAAADGVTDWCVEHGRGLKLSTATVPVVGAAVVYDLTSSDGRRPGPKAGRLACDAAIEDDPPVGLYGVGRGCTVGKSCGREFASPGGQGVAIVKWGDVTVGVVVAVNAFGDVISSDGSILAGSTAESGALRYPYASLQEINAFETGEERTNTTIGCIVTNAVLSKSEACRVSDMAHTGIARSIDPPHTSVDGDALFVLATQQVEASVDLISHLAAQAVAEAVRSPFVIMD